MPVYSYKGKYPTIGRGCYVAPTAVVVDGLTVEDGASVWIGGALRLSVGADSVMKQS